MKSFTISYGIETEAKHNCLLSIPTFNIGKRFSRAFNDFNDQIQHFFTSVIMRVPAAITLLVFCSLIQCTTCTCNATCTTDYISSLNCSCSEPGPAFDYYLEAECRNEDDHSSVSCEMKTPQRWCILELDPYEFPIDALSQCTVKAKNSNGESGVEPKDSTTLTLYENIKPRPPFNISLILCDSSYNVSWETAYKEESYLMGHFIYRLKIRIKGEAKPNYIYVHEDRMNLEIPSSILQSGKDYEVNVQARVNPHRIGTGFWSEWSPTAKWKSKAEEDNGNDYRQFCFLLLIVAPCLLCFFGTRKLWQKKVHVYIPSPEVFFRPLYHAYEGDFKKWAGPAFTFSESDCLEGSMAVSVVKQKQVKSLERLCEPEGEDCSSTASSSFLGMASHSSSEQSTEDQGQDGSAGHISISTVTVLEDESQSLGLSRDTRVDSHGGCFTYPPFSPGGSMASKGLGLLASQCGWDAVISSGCMSGGAGTSESPSSHPSLHHLEPRPCHNNNSELDQSSLESFSFAEHSEDGYPHVALDMDTIDSGFLESDCSSPALSDPDVREKIDAPVLSESFHTNYVKQWVVATDPSAPQGEVEEDC